MTGILGGGLLSQPKRLQCLRCKTAMEEVPGVWKLDEVTRGFGEPAKMYPSGTIYTVGLYRCRSCGFIEMNDKDL